MISLGEQHLARLVCPASWHYRDTLKSGQKLFVTPAVSPLFSLSNIYSHNIQQAEALCSIWRANKGEGALIGETCLYYTGIKADKTESIALFVK